MKQRQGGFLVSKVNQASSRVFARLLRARGLTVHPAHGRILFVLWQNGAMPISELATHVSLTKSTLTNTLDRLEAAGDVRRVRSATDRRAIIVELTERFEDTRKAFEAVSAVMTERFYRGLTAAEIDTFETTLQRILKNLEA